jgi:hypothetical protein
MSPKASCVIAASGQVISEVSARSLHSAPGAPRRGLGSLAACMQELCCAQMHNHNSMQPSVASQQCRFLACLEASLDRCSPHTLPAATVWQHTAVKHGRPLLNNLQAVLNTI